MTSPPPPPKPRRQQIVVIIAVLVVGLCWWCWPRVDQRFVGTWESVDDPDVHVKYWPDGTCQSYIGDNVPEFGGWRWEVRENLLYSEPIPTSTDHAFRIWSLRFSRKPAIILHVDDSTLRLREYSDSPHFGGEYEVAYRRIAS